jgi:hypothetical protein
LRSISSQQQALTVGLFVSTQFSERVVVTANKTDILYWGSRKSDKKVRCYHKEEIASYRVELELHSRLLRQEQILELEDLDELPTVIYPTHFQLVDFDWERLHRHLRSRLGRRAKHVVARAQRKAVSLSRLRRYLRGQGVTNIHRFLVALPINEEVNRALMVWAARFADKERE